jgi:hypothetical protein
MFGDFPIQRRTENIIELYLKFYWENIFKLIPGCLSAKQIIFLIS